MGEKYLFNIYSLLDKKFISLTSANLFPNNIKFNNFEIINISENKILLNNTDKKTIYIIENNDNYDFCLLKQSFKYFSNIVANDKYLLFDNMNENKNKNNLKFSLIDLSNSSNKENSKIIQLLNFKIDNFPKILVNQNFKKLVHLYDNNQLCIIDYIYDENIEDNNINNENIMKINLSKDAEKVIIFIFNFSSCYDNKYHPEKLFTKESYYCSKSNSNEFITFNYKEEYYFNRFKMNFLDDYKDSRPKKFNITILDNKERPIKTYNFINDNIDNKSFEKNLNIKGKFLKFDFLENFGGKYFCIERMNIYVNNAYSIKEIKNSN